MKKILFLFSMVFLLVSCAEPLSKQTKSGKPEGYYPQHSPEQVLNALILMCNDSGGMIGSQSSNYFVCQYDWQGIGKSFTFQKFITLLSLDAGSFKSRMKFQIMYSIVRWQTGTKVYGDICLENRIFLGSLQDCKPDNNKKNMVQKMLDFSVKNYLSKEKGQRVEENGVIIGY